VRLFLFLGILLIAAPFLSAENLLIVDVYARIVPKGQIEPIPDPFIEAIVSGKQEPLPAGVQQVQGKTFQIKSASRDFQGVIPGVDAQRVELSFTAAVLPNGKCAVTDFQLGAASESSRGNALPSNSSQTMSLGGSWLHLAREFRNPCQSSLRAASSSITWYSRRRRVWLIEEDSVIMRVTRGNTGSRKMIGRISHRAHRRFYTRGVRAAHKTEHLSAVPCSSGAL
jgi:hypothetical protein